MEDDARATSDAPRPARKRYDPPRLVHLGSVHELALGASSGFAEGAGTFIKPM